MNRLLCGFVGDEKCFYIGKYNDFCTFVCGVSLKTSCFHFFKHLTKDEKILNKYLNIF